MEASLPCLCPRLPVHLSIPRTALSLSVSPLLHLPSHLSLVPDHCVNHTRRSTTRYCASTKPPIGPLPPISLQNLQILLKVFFLHYFLNSSSKAHIQSSTMLPSQATELKQQAIIEKAQDPNSSVSPEAAKEALVDEAHRVGVAAYHLDPNASKEARAEQMRAVRFLPSI